jgi:hypothetical protein
MDRRWTFGLMGGLLVAGANVLLLKRDLVSLGLDLVVLVTCGTAAIAFVVGYVLGHYADRDRAPGGGTVRRP